MKDKYRIRFLVVVSIVFLCIGTIIKTFQNDTFYVIKLGEHIFYHGVDFVDHWSWIPNLSYTYPHWLYDLLIFIIYKQFGFLGIYASTIFFFILLIFCIYCVHLKLNKNEFMAFFVSLVSISCLYGFATARAQLISATLFFLEIYFIEKLLRRGQKRYIFLLVLDSLLIANLHATAWLFYFILFLPFFGEQIIYKVIHGKLIKKKFLENKILIKKLDYVKELGIGFVFSFLMGIFTPSKICYTYIFRIMMGDSQSFIVEHAPLVVIQHPCFVIFVLLFVLVLTSKKVKIRLYELFMILGIILMALMSTRHLAFFYTIGIFYISRLCILYLDVHKDYTLDILLKLLIHNKIIYVGCVVGVIIFSYSQFIKNQKSDYVDSKVYPVSVVEYMLKYVDISNMRLYNDYDFGSYLMFRNIPVFVDSRCDLYLKEFNGLNYSIFDDEMKLLNNYEEKFEFYDFTHILISKNDLLYQILDGRMGFQILYEDQYFVLFER